MVRKFSSQDMAQVLEIWLAASIRAHAFVPPEFWQSKVAEMRDTYIPGSDVYVYAAEGSVDGFIALRENVIEALFVAPHRQKKGIGSQLLCKAKALFSELQLTVYTQNANAIGFYEKAGFSVVREQIDTHTGQPELLMTYAPAGPNTQ